MPTYLSNLGTPALEAVKALFFSVLNRPLDERFIDFNLDAVQSQLVCTAKEESSDGEVGHYKGTYRWPYVKVSLATTVPYPLALETAYPLTYRALRNQLLVRYNFVVDDHEFALAPGDTPLEDDDLVDTPLMNQYDQLRLYATPLSGRFVADTSLGLIFLQPNQRVPLRGLFDVRAENALNTLSAR